MKYVQGAADDGVGVGRREPRHWEARELRELVDQAFEDADFAADQRGAFADQARQFGRARFVAVAVRGSARRRSAESWMGVSGFLISWAMRCATSCQAAAFCARRSSVRSSTTTT